MTSYSIFWLCLTVAIHLDPMNHNQMPTGLPWGQNGLAYVPLPMPLLTLPGAQAATIAAAPAATTTASAAPDAAAAPSNAPEGATTTIATEKRPETEKSDLAAKKRAGSPNENEAENGKKKKAALFCLDGVTYDYPGLKEANKQLGFPNRCRCPVPF